MNSSPRMRFRLMLLLSLVGGLAGCSSGPRLFSGRRIIPDGVYGPDPHVCYYAGCTIEIRRMQFSHKEFSDNLGSKLPAPVTGPIRRQGDHFIFEGLGSPSTIWFTARLLSNEQVIWSQPGPKQNQASEVLYRYPKERHRVIRKVTRLSLDPASVAETGTNKQSAIPGIRMDDLLLTEALRNLVRQVGLAVPSDDFKAMEARGLERRISLDWQNVTTRQALIALLDHYNLVLVEDQATSSARIALKTTKRGKP